MSSADRARSAGRLTYELRRCDPLFGGRDEVRVLRVEEMGTFPDRAAARQFMVDTTEQRQRRDGADVDGLLAEIERLRAAIEDFRLWDPKRTGYAAAHRRLMAVLEGHGREVCFHGACPDHRCLHGFASRSDADAEVLSMAALTPAPEGEDT